ncbi:hypothetical protein TNCV_529281 [Trichonephila clavipes]|nr:hypothetical protein TNCV_529281 [Trichonephila clavipes]
MTKSGQYHQQLHRWQSKRCLSPHSAAYTATYRPMQPSPKSHSCALAMSHGISASDPRMEECPLVQWTTSSGHLHKRECEYVDFERIPWPPGAQLAVYKAVAAVIWCVPGVGKPSLFRLMFAALQISVSMSY